MYKIAGSPNSRMSRVTWTLEELGEPYEIILAKPQSPEARALNASGRVPVLIDGDLTLTDLAAICLYLAEKHGAKGLGPTDAAERAQMNSWLHFIQSELEAPMWNKLKHRMLLPEELRLDVGKWVEWEFGRDVKSLARRLGDRPFAMGDRFTAVDVVLGHVLNWARGAKFGPFPGTVEAYADRVLSRPALKKAKEREAA